MGSSVFSISWISVEAAGEEFPPRSDADDDEVFRAFVPFQDFVGEPGERTLDCGGVHDLAFDASHAKDSPGWGERGESARSSRMMCRAVGAVGHKKTSEPVRARFRCICNLSSRNHCFSLCPPLRAGVKGWRRNSVGPDGMPCTLPARNNRAGELESPDVASLRRDPHSDSGDSFSASGR